LSYSSIGDRVSITSLPNLSPPSFYISNLKKRSVLRSKTRALEIHSAGDTLGAQFIWIGEPTVQALITPVVVEKEKSHYQPDTVTHNIIIQCRNDDDATECGNVVLAMPESEANPLEKQLVTHKRLVRGPRLLGVLSKASGSREVSGFCYER